MTTNAWDETYFNLIRDMLNKATNIAGAEETASYRCFDIRFNYNLEFGFPISTCRRVDFDRTKEEVATLINSLKKEAIDEMCDLFIDAERATAEFHLAPQYLVYLEKAKGVLTMVVNKVTEDAVITPEETAKLGLFLLVLGRTVGVKNLALQIDLMFCRMHGDEPNALSALLTKETYEAPTVALKKETSLYDYDPSYVTLKSYEYSE